MCGRFAVTLPSDAMAKLFEARPANDLPQVPNYNICPTNAVHSVISLDGARQLVSLRWGFLPHWYTSMTDGPLLINARAETLADKPAFRAAARARRCLIPATGFFEWTVDEHGNRLPWYISPKEDELLAFAGVWQSWEKGDAPLKTCAIVTTAANKTMGTIHHRMPVVLRKEDWALWLGEAGHGAARLMQPANEDALQFWRVDRAVNSNRASGPNLVHPLKD